MRRMSVALAFACAGGCHLLPELPDPLNFPAARAKNLEQLHDSRGGYRYHGVLLGDLGYLVETLSGRDRESYMSSDSIANPAQETMENLVELLDMSGGSGETANLQIEWCARLVHRDPSELVRERAALALGGLGRWAGLRELRPPLDPLGLATPEQVAVALEMLLRSLRLASEGQGEAGGVAAACAAAAELPLGVDGAWRLLSITGELMGLATGPEDRAALEQLRGVLGRLLIEGAIYASLSDESDRVRAAGLRSMVGIIGPRGLTGFLSQPLPGWSETIVLGIVDLVREFGLPGEGISPEAQGRCLQSLLGWAVEHPSARVRVRSMLALQRVVPDGPRSLREEEWHDWKQGAGEAASGSS